MVLKITWGISQNCFAIKDILLPSSKYKDLVDHYGRQNDFHDLYTFFKLFIMVFILMPKLTTVKET